MEAKLKEMEYEKNNIEYTLSRRQDEYMQLNETLLKTKEELEQRNKEYDSLVTKLRQQDSELHSFRDTLHATFVHLSELVSAPEESVTTAKTAINQCASILFPNDDSASSLHSLTESLLLARSATQGSQQCADSTQKLSEAQEAHIKQLEAEAETAQTELETLRKKIAVVELEGTDDQIEELEQTNENLRRALRGAKENMEQAMKRQQDLEQEVVRLQNEFVNLQQSSNEVVQQALAASESKVKEMEEKIKASETVLSQKEEEINNLRVSWESSVGQYEQELAVLRARKVAVEQQISVSERFLEDQTRLHREELAKVQAALQSAQEENQDLKCQVLEREAELESAQLNGEEIHEQLQTTVASLKEQLRVMQQRLTSQQSSVTSSKKKESELEKTMADRLNASIREMEEKDREIIRQQQKSYEEELRRVRDQMSSLTHQLEEERKGNKKMRETVTQLNELFESQDRQIEILKSDVRD